MSFKKIVYVLLIGSLTFYAVSNYAQSDASLRLPDAERRVLNKLIFLEPKIFMERHASELEKESTRAKVTARKLKLENLAKKHNRGLTYYTIQRSIANLTELLGDKAAAFDLRSQLREVIETDLLSEALNDKQRGDSITNYIVTIRDDMNYIIQTMEANEQLDLYKHALRITKGIDAFSVFLSHEFRIYFTDPIYIPTGLSIIDAVVEFYDPGKYINRSKDEILMDAIEEFALHPMTVRDEHLSFDDAIHIVRNWLTIVERREDAGELQKTKLFLSNLIQTLQSEQEKDYPSKRRAYYDAITLTREIDG